MFSADFSSSDEDWGHLQQPAHAGAPDARLRLLLAALDQGWQIEEPAYLRSRWGDSGSRVYHFILRRAFHAPRLVTVPQSPAADRFVQAEGLRLMTGAG